MIFRRPVVPGSLVEPIETPADINTVGAAVRRSDLPANALGQATMMATDTPSSRASPLPQGSPLPTGFGSIFELAALSLDCFCQSLGFGFFVGQLGLGLWLFERRDGGQELFASFGNAKNVIFLFWLWLLF